MDEKKQNLEGNVAPHKLVMLITVVQKGKGTFFADFIKSFDANLQIAVVGSGTADSNLVEFLGLKDKRRSIIFSIVREERVNEIMEALGERFHTVNNDTGISFAVPLSSVIGKLSYGFLSNDQRMVSKNG
ncbi:MAG: hypothetical protein E7194_05450 [Erysipelotrichaceae bacterium]|jgi:hypothetical protein|nr:hypothetical protein [Erysipelotrichaceae bacterium]